MPDLSPVLVENARDLARVGRALVTLSREVETVPQERLSTWFRESFGPIVDQLNRGQAVAQENAPLVGLQLTGLLVEEGGRWIYLKNGWARAHDARVLIHNRLTLRLTGKSFGVLPAGTAEGNATLAIRAAAQATDESGILDLILTPILRIGLVGFALVIVGLVIFAKYGK